MSIVVLGATGMLGHEVLRNCLNRRLEVYGIVRDPRLLIKEFGEEIKHVIRALPDVKEFAQLERLLREIKPSYIINCIGIVKQSHLAEDYFESVSVNSLLPHQLEKYCSEFSCRLIQISTDCVFDGVTGYYQESDFPNALDLYGKSKHLGEVKYGDAITLRTSIIGHALTDSKSGLLEWFLGQKEKVKGYINAIFSGVTTTELSRIILEIVIPQNLAPGIYHIAAEPISKYALLKIVAEEYNKEIVIEPSDDLVIDRSLNGNRFNELTGYAPPSWHELVKEMHTQQMKSNKA